MEFDDGSQWYIHKPASFLENEKHLLLFEFLGWGVISIYIIYSLKNTPIFAVFITTTYRLLKPANILRVLTLVIFEDISKGTLYLIKEIKEISWWACTLLWRIKLANKNWNYFWLYHIYYISKNCNEELNNSSFYVLVDAFM